MRSVASVARISLLLRLGLIACGTSAVAAELNDYPTETRADYVFACMGVRYSDQNWKRQLNQLIQAKQPAITEILLSYGVPLIDEDNHLIEPASNAK